MRVTGYVRVSTGQQGRSGAGLSVQRASIQRECEYRGWELLEIAEDVAYSAKNLKRPGIIRVLDELESGRSDALMVAQLDRLSRSMLDFTAVMALARKQDWAVIALDCAVDTTTPAGEAMANVLATFAQFERRLIGQRIREALAVKKAEGVRLGRPPVLSEAVRSRIAAERAAGVSYRAIAEALNVERVPTAQGGTQWWASTVRAVAVS